VLLSTLAEEARKESLTGLEFAHGIPGTLGGAVFMNAGAFGGEIKDICVNSHYYNIKTLEVGRLEGDAQSFAYRKSFYVDHPECLILGATLSLSPGDPTGIEERMKEYKSRRAASQPLEFPSAGSVFKRPEGDFAARLIDVCGLKGLRVGGAEVSEKHAGFIVNRGGATSEDVKHLIELIRERVRKETGVTLECEIRFLEHER
jgi:UDP-N-acetylmuramate dehydrogenase